MKPHPILLALALAVTAGDAAATQHPSAWETGALPVPANRIVGLWRVDVTIAPCAGGPVTQFAAFNNFHAGGTLSDTNTLPTAARGPGMGIWRYQGRDHDGTARYKVRFQFFRYVNGVLDGVQDIGGTVRLHRNGNSYVHEVRARALNNDGSVRVELCGTALAERVTFAP